MYLKCNGEMENDKKPIDIDQHLSVSIFLIGWFFCWHTIWGWVKIQFCQFHLISDIFLKVDIARVRPIPFEIYIRYQIGRPGDTNNVWHVKAFSNCELKYLCDLPNWNRLVGVGLFIQYEDRESREGLIWQSSTIESWPRRQVNPSGKLSDLSYW